MVNVIKVFLLLIGLFSCGKIKFNVPGRTPFYSNFKLVNQTKPQLFKSYNANFKIVKNNVKNTNCVIILNGLNLRNEIKEIDNVIIYNWSPNCKSKICPSLDLLQNNCNQLGFELFIVSEYYDDLKMSKNYNIKNSLLAIDTKYYKCNLTSIYSNRFYNDLSMNKYKHKSGDKFLYFSKGDFIKSFDSFDKLFQN